MQVATRVCLCVMCFSVPGSWRGVADPRRWFSFLPCSLWMDSPVLDLPPPKPVPWETRVGPVIPKALLNRVSTWFSCGRWVERDKGSPQDRQRQRQTQVQTHGRDEDRQVAAPRASLSPLFSRTLLQLFTVSNFSPASLLAGFSVILC